METEEIASLIDYSRSCRTACRRSSSSSSGSNLLEILQDLGVQFSEEQAAELAGFGFQDAESDTKPLREIGELSNPPFFEFSNNFLGMPCQHCLLDVRCDFQEEPGNFASVYFACALFRSKQESFPLNCTARTQDTAHVEAMAVFSNVCFEKELLFLNPRAVSSCCCFERTFCNCCISSCLFR